jgi:hypothetical protein
MVNCVNFYGSLYVTKCRLFTSVEQRGPKNKLGVLHLQSHERTRSKSVDI